MTLSIDPARRSPGARRPRKTAEEILDELQGVSATPDGSNLPVPIGQARTIPPNRPVASAAQIEAQMMGERRGLRAGAAAIEEAKVTYNKTEWSGAWDRRTPKGRGGKADI